MIVYNEVLKNLHIAMTGQVLLEKCHEWLSVEVAIVTLPEAQCAVGGLRVKSVSKWFCASGLHVQKVIKNCKNL